jgi:hypothetical protein
MTDNFALLNEARRPWLDLESLKAKFLVLSAEVHPDRVHNASPADKATATQHYAAFNAAYNCLREPRERLAHLLECESGGPLKDVQRIPPGTMDLFMEVGQICRDADAFIAERAKVTSPLLKVQMFEKGMNWTDKLNQLQQQINAKRDFLAAELQQLNKAWDSAPPVGSPLRKAALPLDRLEEIYRVFSYVARWTEQIQERVVQLSF